MRKLATAIALVFALVATPAMAQQKKSIDVGTCSEMWKAHKASTEYKDPGKGNRMNAWIEFRKAKCSKARSDA